MRALECTLVTPRLRLEPVTAALAAAARQGGDALADAIGAEAPAEWRANSLSLVAHSAGPSWGERGPIRALAIHRTDGRVIGDVRFEPHAQTHEIEIGYSIAPSWRRQGFATEAAGAVIDWLFAEARLKRAIAGCDRRNRASVRTLRKLGFWLDGSVHTAFWWFIDPDLRAAARSAWV